MKDLAAEILKYHLESPWLALLALPVLAALAIGLVRRLPSVLVSSLHAYRAAGGKAGWRLSPVRWPRLIEAAGLLALVTALVRPQFGIEETKRRVEGIDMVLAIDVSGSMDSIDVPEGSRMTQEMFVRQLRQGKLKDRLGVAREEVKKFIEKRPNDRIGLIAFATHPYTVCPPTLDHDFLLGRLAQLNTDMLDSRQTGIAAPIATAAARLKDSRARRRVLVLFTDGRNNIEDRLSPVGTAKLAAEFNVVVHTVGIGGVDAYVVRGGRLQPSRGEYDRKLLEDIARETKGQFFEAHDAKGLARVMEDVNALEKTSIEQPKFIDYRELFQGWLMAGTVLLLLGLVLEHTVLLKVP